LLGNKIADRLAKMGSYKKRPPNKISFHSAHIKAVVRSRVKNKWNTDSKEKDWETLIKRNSEIAQSRKAEVAKFILNTQDTISLVNI
jgi:pyruvate/2-oxoglutarate dehydrogenase complex dihydrolipoamide dehydrogenase (E3) component